MTFDLVGGRRLLLAGSRLGGLWLAAGVLAVVLLVVLYRDERRLVSRRAGLMLLGLRLLAAIALVAALFEPIAARVYREALRGRVIVAVDVSRSMETVDAGRTDAERAAMSRALGLAPGERVEALSRLDVARRLIDRPGAPVARLAAGHAVEAVAFAGTTAPATLASLAESLRSPPRPEDRAADETDWQPALEAALRWDADDAPTLGVVLLTDGRQNAPAREGVAPVADRLAARGVPVFPIRIGSTVPPRDAAIASVRAPESVYRGDVATIEATVKIDGAPGREVAVTLDRPGGSPIRRVVRAPDDPGAPRPTIAFSIPMEEAGPAAVTLAVGPIEGDVRPDNDRRTVSIAVVDDRADVLLIDGEARWEFRYLRNALARDPRVSVKAVVIRPPASGASARPTYLSTLPAAPPDRGPDPLGAFEAIAIANVAPSDLPAADWARIERFVGERGGSLIVSPGPRSWAALASLGPVRDLLPVISPQPVAVEPAAIDPARPALPPGVRLLPTAAALDPSEWPMFAMAAGPARSRAIWEGLPRLPRVLAGRAKPGATVLATAGPDESAAAIAAQPYGLGKVLWVGTDGTWRWRHRVGDEYHHRFWGQVVRWAAATRLVAGNRLVRFGPIRPRVSEGDAARIQARIADGIPGAGPDLTIAARVYRLDPAQHRSTGESVALVPLSPVVGRPRAYEGVAPALPPGAYAIRLDVPQLAAALHLDGPPAPEARLDVVERETSERVELAAARDPLDRLAAATGGRVLADFEADQLAPLLRARTRTVTRIVETTLWDQPVALIAFFGLLTVEWVARKRLGLP